MILGRKQIIIQEHLTRLNFTEHALSKFGPSNGLIICYDMTNFRAGHLLRNNLKLMRKFITFSQEAMPIKIHEINIFNTWPSFHLIMALIRPIMKAEIINQVSCLHMLK